MIRALNTMKTSSFTTRLGLLTSVLVASAGASLHAAEITVFAAASLTDSLKEIASSYEKQTGDRIVFNFGASGFLARQIEEGAPADIFFSADEAKMDGLERKGLIVRETRQRRLSNTLVIVVAADSQLSLKSAKDLADAKINRVALADPRTVPAGIYAKEYLERARLWSVLEPKVVPTDNVRAALSAVQSGNVEAGIVYKTDASISRKVKVAFEIPAGDGPAISYPMALVEESKERGAAQRFLKYLNSADADRIFREFGFIVRP